MELTMQMRCDDEWYNSMLNECRAGELSNDNHAFLHYKDTTVPGSWLSTTGATACGCCDDLITCTPKEIRQKECQQCQAERIRRARVVGSIPNDNRIHDHFKGAVSIVANNDLKYDICKRRAAEFARDTG